MIFKPAVTKSVILKIVVCMALCLAPTLVLPDQNISAPHFTAIQKPLPDWVAVRMKRHSWRTECPVPLEDLRYILLKHWGYDGKTHDGRLVVHKTVADDVVSIFKRLFDARFPIEKIKLIDEYKGSDAASMADNNTSAFNCRHVTGRPGIYSKHAFGLAIDINPLVNPYITKGKVLPKNGAPYVDRQQVSKGKIRKGDIVTTTFKENGWTWGGDWVSVKDYQHFQTSL